MSVKSDFSIQNNVVNVCCSYLSMVFPCIVNVKYPHGRTYQQQHFESKRRNIVNGKDCITFYRMTAYHCCYSFFRCKLRGVFIPSWMILDQRFRESMTPDDNWERFIKTPVVQFRALADT